MSAKVCHRRGAHCGALDPYARARDEAREDDVVHDSGVDKVRGRLDVGRRAAHLEHVHPIHSVDQ